MALGPGMLLDYLECFMSYSKHIKRPSSNVIDGPAKAIDYVRARAQPSDSDMIYCLYVDCENEVSFMDAFVNETSRDSKKGSTHLKARGTNSQSKGASN